MNNSGLSFSIAAIAVIENRSVVATSRIPGRVTAGIAPEMTLTRSGASSYPAGARAAASDGGIEIILNERPLWVDTLIGEGSSAETAGAANAAAFVQVVGDSITATGFPLLAKSAATPIAPGRYEITATAADRIRVIAVSTAGVQDITAAADGGRIDLAEAGAYLVTPDGGLTIGDRAYYSVGAAVGSQESLISIPQVRKLREYGLIFWSADGTDAASVVEYEFSRVVLAGADVEVVSDRPTTSVLIDGHVLLPLDGSAILKRRVIHSAG